MPVLAASLDVGAWLLEHCKPLWQQAASAMVHAAGFRSDPLTGRKALGLQMALQNESSQLALLLHRVARLYRNWKGRRDYGSTWTRSECMELLLGSTGTGEHIIHYLIG